MTAEIILDILDMVGFKNGISLPLAFKNSSPFLPIFWRARDVRENETVLKLEQIRQT